MEKNPQIIIANFQFLLFPSTLNHKSLVRSLPYRLCLLSFLPSHLLTETIILHPYTPHSIQFNFFHCSWEHEKEKFTESESETFYRVFRMPPRSQNVSHFIFISYPLVCLNSKHYFVYFLSHIGFIFSQLLLLLFFGLDASLMLCFVARPFNVASLSLYA